MYLDKFKPPAEPQDGPPAEQEANGEPVSITTGISERLKHVKTRYYCVTEDSWKLHVIRTIQPSKLGSHLHPVILCPGLGSSGAYSFDLSPSVSLADYLATHGWDVWTVELRGAAFGRHYVHTLCTSCSMVHAAATLICISECQFLLHI
jgi:hypothetical protein